MGFGMVGDEENEIKSFQQNKRVTIRKEPARLCLCLNKKKKTGTSEIWEKMHSKYLVIFNAKIEQRQNTHGQY